VSADSVPHGPGPDDATPTPGDKDAGTVYLIHFDTPYEHARHYTGWAADLGRRLEAHRAGRGSRLMEVIKDADITWRLARTWPGTRDLERAIKDLHEAPRLCPECSTQPLPLNTGRAAAMLGRTPADPAASPQREPAALLAAQEPSPEGGIMSVPDPGPEPSAWPWPAAAPETYQDLLPVTDELIRTWQADMRPGPGPPVLEAESTVLSAPAAEACVPEPELSRAGHEAEPELEL
jgi:predicted GIY-YIG superfamily endonuclease